MHEDALVCANKPNAAGADACVKEGDLLAHEESCMETSESNDVITLNDDSAWMEQSAETKDVLVGADMVETGNIDGIETVVRLETEISIVSSQADAAQLVDNGSDIIYAGYEYSIWLLQCL